MITPTAFRTFAALKVGFLPGELGMSRFSCFRKVDAKPLITGRMVRKWLRSRRRSRYC